MADQEYPGPEDLTFSPPEGNTVGSLAHDDTISLVEIASVLLRQRYLIVLSTILCAAVSVVLALNKPTLFTSSGSFLPENSGGGLSTASALAQQFGFSIGGSSGTERSSQFYANLLTSKEILRQVVTRRYPSLGSSGEGAGEQLDLVTYYQGSGEIDEVRIEQAVINLTGGVSVSRDRDTGIIRFSVTTSDPVLSQAVAASILQRVNDFDLTTRQSQARAERLFSEERLVQLTRELQEAEDGLKTFLLDNRIFTSSPALQFEHDRLQREVMMRQELVTSIAQAFENARIEEVRNTPVITTIEFPRVPPIRDPKGRIGILMVGVLMGVMVGIFLAFLRNYSEEHRAHTDPRLSELSSLWKEALSEVTPIRRRPSA